MDASIRQLLATSNAVKTDSHAHDYLHQAYKLLDAAVKESTRSDDSSPCGSDLFVIAAETAYKLDEKKLAEGALQMYFQGTPLTDQFLCRAYLCKAQILASKTPSSSTDLDSAVVFLLKAINFAKDKPRYHFIVFNASVLFWQMARPFMRPGMRGLLHQSLQQIVKALDDIDDQDHDWRVTLMVGLVESLIDAGKMKEATAVSESAAEFTLKYAKLRFKDVFRLQVRHKLVEQSKLSKGVNNMPEFLAFLKLQKVKRSVTKPTAGTEAKLDLKKDLHSVMKLLGATRERTPLSLGRKRSGRPGSPEGLVRAGSRSPQRRSSRTLSKASLDIPETLMSEMGKDLLPGLLLEIARFCTDCEEIGFARDCVKSLEALGDKDAGFQLEIECLKCQMLIKDLGEKQEMYIKSSVDVRLFAIKRMDQHIQNAVRSGNASVVQTACVTQWNICLPLLQPNLRKHIRRPLTLVAQALEDIMSLEIKIRCQIHTELAKCEEDVEQVEAALRHIRKALQLDQSGLYHQRLQTMLRRLELSTQLYQSPETPEDTAAVIIEQARKSADSGTVRMKRSLLVKAGLALAPDAFQYVLDSEGEVKVAGQKALSEAHMLGAKAAQWQKCVKKAAGHLKRLGDENDSERARLWADLAKVARKQEVWDVCRVAARFCLLYDDNRWGMARSRSNRGGQSGMPTNSDIPESQEAPTDMAPSSAPNQYGINTAPDTSESVSLHDTDLLRMLAEVQFISGEALIHLLQCQGLKLSQTPRFPVDAHQRPKSIMGSHPAETDTEWITYTEWIKQLSNLATRSFLRAIELGIDLRESWIVCSGTTYLWNYSKHLIADGRHTQLVEAFEAALNGLRTMGHSSETVSLVRVCNLIAQGLLRPWLVSKSPTDPSAEPPPDTAQSSKPPSRKKTPGKASVGASGTTSVDPEAGDDLKHALEVCEYALQVTNGTIKKDIIPTAVRRELIATWVLLKQMSQQQIGPGLGVENEAGPAQRDMTKALVLLEMHLLNGNGVMEFTCPSLSEAADITEAAEWNDASVELEVWTRLAFLAHSSKDHPLVAKCAEKALAFDSYVMKTSKRASGNKRNAVTDFEALSYAACILGESIMTTVTSNPYARRKAMESFAISAKYAEFAGNYDLVMTACRWWWNACLPLMSSPIERELLRQPLSNLLHFITSTGTKLKLRLEQQEKAEAESAAIPSTNTESIVRDQDSDNTLRAAMYGILFQTYTDKAEWEEALSCMDQAVHHMPRTKHRLPIFKDRIMVKAKLGRSVDADIAKFREESEEYVAHMWHRVALSSHEQMQQLSSYQKAIESLHSDKNVWVKFEYLAELSAWLYCNEYPKSDAVNVLEWAADILFSMEFEQVPKEEKSPPSKGKSRKTPGKPSRTPGTRGSAKTREGKRGVKIDLSSKPGTSEAKTQTDKDGENEKSENSEEFVPVEKAVIIGLEKANVDLKMDQLNSVRQLEGLVRCHVMLSTISGRGSLEHKTYCLLAVGFIMRIWEIGLAAAGPLIAQLPKTEESAPKAGNPPPAKAQKKGPPEALPETYAEWSTYTPPEDVCRAFTFNEEDTAISSKTITKAELTVHYLEELVNELKFLGYDHLALPVLCFNDVITSHIIKSETWANYVRLGRIKVCYELGLVESAKAWEAKVGQTFLPEEEQSAFVQEKELMVQHEKQVEHEEARIKEESRQESRNGGKANSSPENSELLNLQRKKIKGVCMRRLWTEKAILLLDLGYHQHARRLLDQSLASATALRDEALKGDIYLALAQLSIQESNLGQGIRFLKIAQDIGGDEQYWYKVVQLLTDALLFDPDVTSSKKKEAYSMMKLAIDTMEILKPMRKTKEGTIFFIMSVLEARLSIMKINDTVTKNDHPVGFHKHLSRLDAAEEILLAYGYTRETTALYRQHASLVRKLFEMTVVEEERHALLLVGLEKLQHGMEILTELYSEVTSSIDQTKNVAVCLPILRELCDIQLDLAEYSLNVYDVHASEQITSSKLEAKSGSLEHILKEYIGNQENLTDLEREWKHACTVLPQKIFSILITSFSFTAEMPHKKTRSIFLLGRALRLLGTYSAEHVDAKWSVFAYNVTAGEDEVAENRRSVLVQDEVMVTDSYESIPNSKSKSSVDSTLTLKQRKKLGDNAVRLIRGENVSKTLLCQASEVLLQSVKIALELGMVDIVRDASVELVELLAQLDCNSASLFLALHQSAKASLSMRDLLKRSQPDPSVSQLSALMHQEAWLTNNSQHMHTSSVFEWIRNALCKFTAWKRLAVLPNAIDQLKDFPPNFNFVVLQHSPNRNHLYASILDKPKPATQTSEGKSKGKDKQGPSAPESRAYVLRASVDPNMLDNIKERMEEYRMRLMSFLLQSEYQRAQMAMRKKMLEQLSLGNENPAPVSKTSLEEQEEEEMKIMDEFQGIVDSIESYLIPVTSMLKEHLIDPLVKACKEQIESGRELDPNSMESVVLLLDEDLMCLPIEALQCFQTPFIDCLCRDFSLQMSYHRWHVDPEEAAAAAEKKKNEPAAKGNPKTPKTGKDTRKTPAGGGKVVPLNREVLPGTLTLSTNNIHYIVDPLDETAETEEYKPIQVFNQILQTYATSCTSMWTGLMGSSGIPSAGQWEQAVKCCDGFIFYGTERFFANLPPSKVAAFDLDGCQLMVLLDKAQTSKSFRHQSKVDVDKSDSLLLLEKTLPTIKLLSLVGVNSICGNIGHSTLEDNANKLQCISRVLLDEGQVIGKAMRSMLNPMLSKPKPPDPPATAPTGKDDAKAGKAGKTKSDSRKGKASPMTSLRPTPEPEVAESPSLAGEEVEPFVDNTVQASWCNTILFGLPNVMVV